MESKDGEVGIRLDASLQERIGAYAARESLTPGEALSALLYLGLEFAERQRTGLRGDRGSPAGCARSSRSATQPAASTPWMDVRFLVTRS